MSYEHIDVGRLRALTGELANDSSACVRFVDDYITAWSARQERVSIAVDEIVIDDALAALLSLSTSSAMIGADGLSASARDLYAESRMSGTIPARGAARLARLGHAVCLELRLATAELRVA